MADIKWIKICTDIFDDDKILLIESMPEADGIIVIWFKLLCMAGKQNNSGVFMLNDRIAYNDEMLATIFRRPVNVVRLALNVFEQYGMIEIVSGTITIPKWEKHQSLDKMEEMREQTRLRVAKHREKQKLLTNSEDCNVTVTLRNATDKKRKEEKREEENRKEKKERNKENSYDLILSAVTDDSLRELYFEYIKMRKLIKSPMTERALTMLINKVNELEPNSIERQKQLLETAIMNNWKSVYPLKDNIQTKQQQGTGNIFLDMLIEENEVDFDEQSGNIKNIFSN